MPRPPRVQCESTWYHVFNRGNNLDNIFWWTVDYEIFLSTLKEACRYYEAVLSAYCLMTNHYHLVVFTHKANLSEFMKYLDGVYTKRFNYSHGRKGHVFGGRYQSKVVMDDSYLLQLVRYVHLNPIKAGIVLKPDGYRWSSHTKYLTRDDSEWFDSRSILGMLSAKLDISQYLDFMNQNDPNFKSFGV